MNFFFYGTLIDPDVRRMILGDIEPSSSMENAHLTGWRRVGVRGRSYPALVHRAGHVTHGVLARDLPASALDALVAYEGPEYEVREESVRCGATAMNAYVFVAGPECVTTPVAWSYDQWQRRCKRRFIAELRQGRLS